MAKSARQPDPAFAAFTEDTVLCELNADFKRSKRELIDRFLQDQEELNRRFEEYALATDGDDGGKGNALYRKGLEAVEIRTISRLDREMAAEDDEAVPDNLSTTSAVHTSSVESIPDVIDLEVEENMLGCYADDVDESQAWREKANAKAKLQKSKKLTKKNIRPKTSMGIRKSRAEPGITAPSASPVDMAPVRHPAAEPHCLSASISCASPRARQTPWTADPKSQHTRSIYVNPRPASRIRDSYVPTTMHMTEPSARVSSRASLDILRQVSGPGLLNREGNLVHLHGRRDTAARDTSSGGRRDSTGRDRLTLAFNSPITAGALGARPKGRSHPGRVSRDMYTTETALGPVQAFRGSTPTLSSKRQIAVLKLPPLEGAVVSKSLATEQPTLMATPAKGTQMQPTAEFMAGWKMH